MNSQCHNTATGSLFHAINDKKALSFFHSSISLSPHKHTPTTTITSSWQHPLDGWALSELQESGLVIVLLWKWLFLCVSVRVKAGEKGRSLQHFLHSHIVNPFLQWQTQASVLKWDKAVSRLKGTRDHCVPALFSLLISSPLSTFNRPHA